MTHSSVRSLFFGLSSLASHHSSLHLHIARSSPTQTFPEGPENLAHDLLQYSAVNGLHLKAESTVETSFMTKMCHTVLSTELVEGFLGLRLALNHRPLGAFTGEMMPTAGPIGTCVIVQCIERMNPLEYDLDCCYRARV